MCSETSKSTTPSKNGESDESDENSTIVDLRQTKERTVTVIDRNGGEHVIDPFTLMMFANDPEFADRNDLNPVKEVLGPWSKDMPTGDIIEIMAQCGKAMRGTFEDLKKRGLDTASLLQSTEQIPIP